MERDSISRRWLAVLAGAIVAGIAAAACADSPRPLEAPEVLSSNVIFAKRCDRILYSSNRDDYIKPFVIGTGVAPGDKGTPLIESLAVSTGLDLFVRSLSADCKTVALVGDPGGTGIYDVYLFDLTDHRLTDLTASSDRNEGEPEFAPVGASLAYLDDGALRLHDVAARRAIAVPRSPAPFRALTWSSEGDRIFLEDRATALWQYDIARSSFRLLWKASRRANTSRMMYHARDPLGDGLYFVSDHESDVTQIYRLDLAALTTSQVYPSRYDQYSPQIDPGGHLIFRTNVDGNYVAHRLRNGKAEAISPSRGVVYDLSLDFVEPLFVYAADRAILSVYAAERGDTSRLTSLVPIDFPVTQRPARELRGADGMVHFIYEPMGLPKGWVVWLHGGPNEQVSPRFNLYFDFLLRLGYAVAAINYPGSTGIGNHYELREVPDSVEIGLQLAGIADVLGVIAKQYPSFGRYVLVGVSYGSTLGYLHLRDHPDRVTKFIDFSGATDNMLRWRQVADCAGVRSLLLIQGLNDPQRHSRARRALLSACDQEATIRRVVLADEGHFIRHRNSIRRILGEIDRFLAMP